MSEREKLIRAVLARATKGRGVYGYASEGRADCARLKGKAASDVPAAWDRICAEGDRDRTPTEAVGA